MTFFHSNIILNSRNMVDVIKIKDFLNLLHAKNFILRIKKLIKIVN